MPLLIVLALLSLFSCIPKEKAHITVAAAANLTFVMSSLTNDFVSKHKDISIEVVLGSSGKLASQIRNGAPYKIFMAANTAYPKALENDGYTVGGSRVYASGLLVIFSTTPFTTKNWIDALYNAEKAAIANPYLAPYGKAAVEAIAKAMDDYDTNSLVIAETISQSFQYALSGGVSVSFIAFSSLFGENVASYNREGVYYLLVDKTLYSPISQAAVLLKNGDSTAASLFYEYIYSKDAKQILASYGYGVE